MNAPAFRRYVSRDCRIYATDRRRGLVFVRAMRVYFQRGGKLRRG